MEHIVKWFERVICRRGWQKLLKWDRNGLKMAEKLYFRERKEEVLLHIRCRQFLILLFGLFIIVLIFIACLRPIHTEKVQGGFIEREQETEVDILVEMEKDGVENKEKLHFQLPERQLTQKERQECHDELEQYLKKCILGKNLSLDQVNRKLVLPESIKGGEVLLKWTVDERYMRTDGRLRKAKIPTGGISTSLMAAISYRGWKDEIILPIVLLTKPLTLQEQMIKTVKREIKRSIQSQDKSGQIQLPNEIDGISLNYRNVPKQRDFTPVFAAVAVMLILPLWWKEKEKKKLLQRSSQLLLDYPGFVNQIMLLLSAGMTVRGALERVSEEYEKKRKQGAPKRYAYEELWGLCQDIRNGVPEGTSIEAFGIRCQLLPYTKFAAILCQSRKRGTTGVTQLLNAEACETFEKRKEHVKRLGEEAGTKLLFPLLLMLILVIGIIMIPAFLTF